MTMHTSIKRITLLLLLLKLNKRRILHACVPPSSYYGSFFADACVSCIVLSVEYTLYSVGRYVLVYTIHISMWTVYYLNPILLQKEI